MNNYKADISYEEKIKKLDKYLLTKKKNKGITDDLILIYLIENELLKNECKICKQDMIWNKKPLQLVLDRINNVITDNRLINLRLLCPNCFSQLKKRKIIFKKMTKDLERICIDCKKRIKNSNMRYDNLKCKKLRCKNCLNKKLIEDETLIIKTI